MGAAGIFKRGMVSGGLFNLGLFPGGAPVESFTFTVTTDNAGTSNDNQFTIPLYAGETYDFTVAYDGQETTHNTDSDLTLTFPSGAGTYPIVITGTFPRIYFNNGGDKLKLTDVAQPGDVGWTSMQAAFFGCSNCLSFGGAFAADPSLGNFRDAYRSCSSATSFTSLVEITDLTSLLNTYLGCSGCLLVPVMPTASTSLTTCQNAFQSIGSGMLGTVVELWNTTNFPNLAIYVNTFTGTTGLTNYGDIPDAWKGL